MSNKNRQTDNLNYEYDDEDDYRPNKKKQSPRRRPVRNWKKAWDSKYHSHDEIDDFYSK
jgi:hypothetical protein